MTNTAAINTTDPLNITISATATTDSRAIATAGAATTAKDGIIQSTSSTTGMDDIQQTMMVVAEKSFAAYHAVLSATAGAFAAAGKNNHDHNINNLPSSSPSPKRAKQERATVLAMVRDALTSTNAALEAVAKIQTNCNSSSHDKKNATDTIFRQQDPRVAATTRQITQDALHAARLAHAAIMRSTTRNTDETAATTTAIPASSRNNSVTQSSDDMIPRLCLMKKTAPSKHQGTITNSNSNSTGTTSNKNDNNDNNHDDIGKPQGDHNGNFIWWPCLYFSNYISLTDYLTTDSSPTGSTFSQHVPSGIIIALAKQFSKQLDQVCHCSPTIVNDPLQSIPLAWMLGTNELVLWPREQTIKPYVGSVHMSGSTLTKTSTLDGETSNKDCRAKAMAIAQAILCGNHHQLRALFEHDNVARLEVSEQNGRTSSMSTAQDTTTATMSADNQLYKESSETPMSTSTTHHKRKLPAVAKKPQSILHAVKKARKDTGVRMDTATMAKTKTVPAAHEALMQGDHNNMVAASSDNQRTDSPDLLQTTVLQNTPTNEFATPPATMTEQRSFATNLEATTTTAAVAVREDPKLTGISFLDADSDPFPRLFIAKHDGLFWPCLYFPNYEYMIHELRTAGALMKSTLDEVILVRDFVSSLGPHDGEKQQDGCSTVPLMLFLGVNELVPWPREEQVIHFVQSSPYAERQCHNRAAFREAMKLSRQLYYRGSSIVYQSSLADNA